MTSRPYDLVIFDCDGVLVDSERISSRVFASLLEDIGLRFKGNGSYMAASRGLKRNLRIDLSFTFETAAASPRRASRVSTCIQSREQSSSAEL